jgi:hypothetical protein
MHLRGTQCEVGGHLGDWRTCAGVADQFGKDDDVLGEQTPRHSLFWNLEYRLTRARLPLPTD